MLAPELLRLREIDGQMGHWIGILELAMPTVYKDSIKTAATILVDESVWHILGSQGA